MKYLTAMHTDIGTRKKMNQDSIIVLEAQTGMGNILFASVCDGMGGLAKGEVASAAMVRAFESWFENDLPSLVQKMQEGTFEAENLWEQWCTSAVHRRKQGGTSCFQLRKNSRRARVYALL